MKLYYTPGTCSMAPHIVLQHLGLPHTLVKVDLQTKKTEAGDDFMNINPKESVPVLELETGERITEGPAIMQYLADLKPEANVAGKVGTLERTRVQEALNFVTSELHKTFVPLFSEHYCCDKQKEAMIERLKSKFAVAEQLLAGQKFLANNRFSVADVYLYNVSRWLGSFDVSCAEWPHVKAVCEYVHSLPATKAILQAEKLNDACC